MGTRLVYILLLLISSVISIGGNQDSIINQQTKIEYQKALHDASYYNALFAKTSIDSNDFRLQYARLAYDVAVRSRDNYQKALALLNIGIAYNHQYRYNLAMESYLKAKGIADSIVSPELSASVFHNMGELYLDMRNTQLARDFFLRALKVRKKSSTSQNLAETLNGLALVSWLSGNFDHFSW